MAQRVWQRIGLFGISEDRSPIVGAEAVVHDHADAFVKFA